MPTLTGADCMVTPDLLWVASATSGFCQGYLLENFRNNRIISGYIICLLWNISSLDTNSNYAQKWAYKA